MAQYLSEDLRIRVIQAIEGGMSRNAAARRFGVSIASAVRWMDDYLRTRRTAPKQRGGDRRSGRIEAQHAFLMAAIETKPDITLAELREWTCTDLMPLRFLVYAAFASAASGHFLPRAECLRRGL